MSAVGGSVTALLRVLCSKLLISRAWGYVAWPWTAESAGTAWAPAAAEAWPAVLIQCVEFRALVGGEDAAELQLRIGMNRVKFDVQRAQSRHIRVDYALTCHCLNVGLKFRPGIFHA